MGATYDDKVVRDQKLHTHKQHWTITVLEGQDDGSWLTTQGSVAVEGHGETAADAAAKSRCWLRQRPMAYDRMV